MSREVRQDLTLIGFSDTIQGTDSLKTVAFRSKVNMPRGSRFTIDAIDVIHNNFDLELLGAQPQDVVRYTFVSCWPIAVNNNPGTVHAYGMYDMPTMGSRHDIMFTMTELCTMEPQGLPVWSQVAQWPANELAGFPTMSFVTPHVYITVIYQVPNEAGDEESVKIVSPSASLYMAYREKSVSNLSYTLGYLNERSTAMLIYQQNTGQVYDNYGPSTMGEWFPSWIFGGVRPSLFLTWGSGAEDYLDTSTDDAEEMDSLDNMQRDFTLAVATSAYDEIYGTNGGSAAPSMPDWVKYFGLEVVGIMADVSTRRIPQRRDDEGALRTFDAV